MQKLPLRTAIDLVSTPLVAAGRFDERLAAWLRDATGLPICAHADLSGAARERLAAGSPTVLTTICGSKLAAEGHDDAASDEGAQAGPPSGFFRKPLDTFDVLAAPVMVDARYRGQATFLADVIVSRRSDVHTFEDLRGGVVAYDDAASFEGLAVLLDHLRLLGETRGFFRSAIASGSHQASLDMVASRLVDVAAVDSRVLEAEVRRRPLTGREVRVLASFGPFPAPPLVVRKDMPDEAKELLLGALTIAHGTKSGAEVLALRRIARFVATTRAAYEPLHDIVRRAAGIPFVRGSSGARVLV